MRDLLRPSEYGIIKATLEHLVTLDCTGCGTCFGTFWQLPPLVREHISSYECPKDEKGIETKRFEVYVTDQETLLVLAFYGDDKYEPIEVVGQHVRVDDTYGIFVRQPKAVSLAMVAKARAMSRERWSSKSLSPSERFWFGVGLWLTALGFVAWASVAILGYGILDFARSMDEGWGVAFLFVYTILLGPVSLAGAVYLIGIPSFNWREYRRQHSALTTVLSTYATN